MSVYVRFTPWYEMTEKEQQEWATKVIEENGPKPDIYDFQDYIEDDINLI